MKRSAPRVRPLACALLALLPFAALAAEPLSSREAFERLRLQIEEQSRRLDALREEMNREQQRLQEIRNTFGIDELAQTRGAGAPGTSDGPTAVASPVAPPGSPATPAAPPARALAQADTAADRPPRTPAESKPQGPQVAQIFEQPGILTQPGHYVLEPSLQYAYSSNNRVALVGYTVIPAIAIGLIDIREVKHNTWTAALTGRLGITRRFELEAKLPWAYRSDDSIRRPLATPASNDAVFNTDGRGLGDVEFTGRYQLNEGGVDKPFLVASLRFKTRTGKDPFEVLTDFTVPDFPGLGLPRELPTGSGFYTLQPGLTFLLPSDPVVFFGSINYQYNLKRKNVDLKEVSTSGTVTTRRLASVQAGGVFGFNFGMGLALNDRASFSIGYDHASVGKTRINDEDDPLSVRVQLGTLLLGYSYRLSPQQTLNLSVGVGVTGDAPDLQLTARLPISL